MLAKKMQIKEENAPIIALLGVSEKSARKDESTGDRHSATESKTTVFALVFPLCTVWPTLKTPTTLSSTQKFSHFSRFKKFEEFPNQKWYTFVSVILLNFLNYFIVVCIIFFISWAMSTTNWCGGCPSLIGWTNFPCCAFFVRSLFFAQKCCEIYLLENF